MTLTGLQGKSVDVLFLARCAVPVPSWISEAFGERVPVDLQLGDLAQKRGTNSERQLAIF